MGAKESQNNKATNAEVDDQHTDLTVHGARNLAHTLATARRFIFRKGLPVYTKEYDAESVSKKMDPYASDPFKEPTWSDENIRVWVLPATPSAASPRSQSPKKRSLDEFREDGRGLEQVNQQTKDQYLRQHVVSHMFDSDWTIDSLEETRLDDVQMPAQIFVRNPETKDLEKYQGPLPGGDAQVADIKVLVRKPWPGAAINKIPTTTKCEESLCYIIKSYDLRGKFDANKAHSLGIDKGPAFGLLAKGESIQAADGKVVTPDMVMAPPTPGKGLAIIDLPTPQYVESLVTRPEWKSPTVMNSLEAFIWILGPGVGEHPRLRDFVDSMSNSKHIVSSPDYSPNYLAMQSVATSSMRMARLRPQNYAVPVHDNQRIPQRQIYPKPLAPVPAFQAAEPGLIVRMVPELRLVDTEVVPRLNTADILEKVPYSAEERAANISRKLSNNKHKGQMQEYLKNLPGANAEIFTLGTGSSQPSKYRNVSSTLVYVPGKGYYLFDSGEGTLGQLRRMFEPKQLREVLQNLRMIWISHLHADHHLGTVSVIKAWYQENYPGGVPKLGESQDELRNILDEKRLFLISDRMMIEWLEEYAGVEDFGFGKLVSMSAYPYRGDDGIKTSFLFRHCSQNGSYPGREIEDSTPPSTELRFDKQGLIPELLRKATGLKDVLTTYVSHCRGSMAVSLVFDDGFKISYSGDCRPSPSFAEIGKDSTVLIHEATFDDDMGGSAIGKKHSTAGEAIKVGRRMHARSILLTHFSQRYQKIAHFEKYDDPQYNHEEEIMKRGEFRAFREREAAAKQQEEQTAAAAAAAAAETQDVPIDNEVQEDLSSENTEALTKPESEEPDNAAPSIVPIVAAVDHMRVRLRDMYTLEHYAPAFQKLFDTLERASALQTAKNKKMRQAEDIQQQEKKKAQRHAKSLEQQARSNSKNKAHQAKDKNKEQNMDNGKGKTDAKAKGATSPPPPSPSRSSSPSLSPRQPGSRSSKKSIWSAPDSDSGWWNSPSDSENGASSQ